MKVNIYLNIFSHLIEKIFIFILGIELGVAETNLMKAIAQCTGRTLAQIKTDVQEVGDLGIVAEGSRSNQRTMFQPAPLTVSSVYTRLKEIAQMTGSAV